MLTPQQRVITAAALRAGIDPSWALAVAERESAFNPQARSSKTIRGLYQMSGKLRQKYGIGDSDDPTTQTAGWARFFAQNKREMAAVLGRDPTDEEGYLGHHFGGARAARMMGMDPNTPVDQVFTPQEMAANPHFARAGTVGRLNQTILTDMQGRHRKFGQAMPDFSGEADRPDAPDFSSFGDLADPKPAPAEPPTQQAVRMPKREPASAGAGPQSVSGNEGTSGVAPSPKPGGAAGRMADSAGGGALDLSQFGTPVS